MASLGLAVFATTDSIRALIAVTIFAAFGRGKPYHSVSRASRPPVTAELAANARLKVI